MSSNSREWHLYCPLLKDVFVFKNTDILPGRCEGCEKKTCLEVMKQRVRDNIENAQLEFNFGKEVTNE